MDLELAEIHDRCVLSTSFHVSGSVLSKEKGWVQQMDGYQS